MTHNLTEKCVKWIDFEDSARVAAVRVISQHPKPIVNACKTDFLGWGTFPYLVALHKIGKMMK